jgi:predicted RNase H-like HicB family nuclease
MQSDTPKAKLIAVFEPCEEGGYHAFIPDIPGIHTQGETLEEARENLADAIGQWLADELDDTLSDIPPTDRVEVDLIEKVLLKRETTRT